MAKDVMFSRKDCVVVKGIRIMPSIAVIRELGDDLGPIIGRAIQFFGDDKYQDSRRFGPHDHTPYWEKNVNGKTLCLLPYKDGDEKKIVVLWKDEAMEFSNMLPDGTYRHGA